MIIAQQLNIYTIELPINYAKDNTIIKWKTIAASNIMIFFFLMDMSALGLRIEKKLRGILKNYLREWCKINILLYTIS